MNEKEWEDLLSEEKIEKLLEDREQTRKMISDDEKIRKKDRETAAFDALHLCGCLFFDNKTASCLLNAFSY